MARSVSVTVGGVTTKVSLLSFLSLRPAGAVHRGTQQPPRPASYGGLQSQRHAPTVPTIASDEPEESSLASLPRPQGEFKFTTDLRFVAA